MKVAVLELDLCSIHLALATLTVDGRISLLGDFLQDIPLANSWTQGRAFARNDLDQTVVALKNIRQILRRQTGVEQVRLCGNPLLKEAENVGELSAKLTEIFEVPLEILSTGDLAAYGFLGSHDTRALPPGGLVVTANVGTHSTQLSLGDAARILEV
jgi:exopolyphosphatase/pppGpp-phosphohydrolase